jgi:uncharacterized protein (DUF2249 family)/mannose-6-phosphate isomerase-like protein (cupin superfamily)
MRRKELCGMEKHNVRELIEYSDAKPFPKVLINRPGYRMLLMSMRSGQKIPEHATKEMVTVYAVSGYITFYAGAEGCDLRAGEVICVDANLPHRLEAHEDSALLVIAAGNPRAPGGKGLDLRAVPRPERHTLVFATFDGLAAGEDFLLINDHDPVPLRRQMEAMRPGQMTWEYLERGPNNFRICVRRIASVNGGKSSEDSTPEVLLQEIRGA